MAYLLFFLSGAAALVYEIAWSRQLGLFFGHTVHSSAVVLGAYFAGMALGNWLAGHWASRIRRPLIGYGAAELAVAAWAALTPFVIKTYGHPAVAGLLNHPDHSLQLAIRAAVAFLTLLPATIALGATLPFIAQHVSPAGAPQPRRIALAYSINTAGAFAGVGLATFALILWLGVSGSGWLAAGVSAACGIAALALARSQEPQQAKVQKRRSAEPQSFGGLPLKTWYILAAVSGFLTLGSQVLYTRLVALSVQNSTYTFGTVVAVFLAALSLGAWIVSRLAKRYSPAELAIRAFGPTALMIPTCILAFRIVTGFRSVPTELPYWAYLLLVTGLAALAALPAVTVMGLLMPAAYSALSGEAAGPGRTVGRLTAVNTVSAATGALLTSFVILPGLGLTGGFILIAAIYFCCGAALAIRVWGTSSGATWTVMSLIGFVAVCLTIARPVAIPGPGEEVVWQRETPYGVISVRETAGAWRSLYQDNNYRLGSTYKAELERRQAHLPLLLHPAPESACFLGLATGITAGAALAHDGIEEIVAVELIPEVVEAAAQFGTANGGVLTDPRAGVVVNDARHYLLATDRRFDVIISDLFVPWHSQTGYLYTAEHYQTALSRLNDGGVFCQWLALYEVAPRELETIANTLAAVFPYVTLWRDEVSSGSPLIALVGTRQPLRLEAAGLNVRWGRIQGDYSQLDPSLERGADVLQLYVCDWWGTGEKLGLPPQVSGQFRLPALVADLGLNRQLNTDDRPLIEFLAPVSDGNHHKLTGNRLRDYYDAVLLRLPQTMVEYIPLRGEPAPDIGAGRAAQRVGIQDAPAGGARALY